MSSQSTEVCLNNQLKIADVMKNHLSLLLRYYSLYKAIHEIGQYRGYDLAIAFSEMCFPVSHSHDTPRYVQQLFLLQLQNTVDGRV